MAKTNEVNGSGHREPDKGMHYEILRIYEELDERIALFQQASGLRCPPGCGACCLTQEVEATVLEVLPLAKQVLLEEKGEDLICTIEERENQGNRLCVLYRPDPSIPGNGRCDGYGMRPLLCRLFGYGARRNKREVPELCACWLLKEKSPHEIIEAEESIRQGFDVPLYQDTSLRVATLDPYIGFRRLPINLALKGALEKLCWEKRSGPS